MPTPATRLEALSAAYDALYDGPEVSYREMQVINLRAAVLLWEMVQLEIAMGEKYGEDDVINYRRQAERAQRWLNVSAAIAEAVA